MNNERYGLPIFSGMMVANCKKMKAILAGSLHDTAYCNKLFASLCQVSEE